MDEEHLRLLSIFHYVLAGLSALLALLGAVPLLIAGALAQAYSLGGVLFPREIAPLLALLVVLCALLAVLYIVALALTGYWLSVRRHYTFCMVVAAGNCLAWPLGTVLGILTLIVLVRPRVKALFGLPAAPSP